MRRNFTLIPEFSAGSWQFAKTLLDGRMKFMMLLAALYFLPFCSSGQTTVSVVYDSAGTFTFVAPPCVTSVKVQTWGGGGGGGGGVSNPANDAGGGGGGGGYTLNANVTVTPGSSYTVVVGTGGTAATGAAGGPGGSSSFNGSVVAAGGSGGGIYDNFFSSGNGTGGNGGVGGTYSGGNGSQGDHPNYGGGGGGGAGSAGNGSNAGTPNAGTGGAGGPGAQQGGSGGNGADQATGSPGNAPGGGGGGAFTANLITGTPESGGPGAPGQVIITYTLTLPSITSVTGSGCSGTQVSIAGTNLGTATGVTIGSTALNNLSVTSTLITGTIATGTVTGKVIVTTPCGADTSATSFTVYPAVAPVNLGTQSLCTGPYVFGGHTYTTAGTYSDTSANVNGCDSITTVTLAGGQPVTASLSQTVCAGGSYSFGGHSYSSTGVYLDTATSTVTGCDSITTLTLTVTSIINQSVAQTICAGSSYTFGGRTYSTAGVYADTATSSVTNCDSITTLTLNLTPVITQSIAQSICPGGSYTFNGHSYNIPGTYSDTATSTVSGCDSITTLTLSVSSYPYHDTTLTICAGSSFSFNGHTYNASGIYADTLIGAGANGCDSISALILNVGAAVTATISDSICNGASYSFNGQSLTTAGSYSDTIAGGSAGGCDSITTLILSIKSGSGVPVEATAAENDFCPGDSVQICATTGFAAYAWSSGNTTACFYTPDAGSYTVTATYADGCTAASNQVNVSTFTPTPVTISQSGDTLTCAGAVSYQWFYNGNPIPGAISGTLIAVQPGSYTVEITDPHGCYYFSSAAVITTGIGNVYTDDEVRVYPNPSSGSWHLAVGNNLVGARYEVYDVAGRVVLQSAIGSGQLAITLPDAASGVYELRIISTEGMVVKKLVKL